MSKDKANQSFAERGPRSLEIEPYRTKRGGHTPEMIEMGLMTLATCGGRTSVAAQTLAAKGIEIPKGTLNYWRYDLYPNRYRDIVDRYSATIEREIVNNVRALALRASEAAHKMLELEEQRIVEGDVRDAAGSLRNIATAIGISVDKIMILEGRPNQITESRSADDVLRGLRDRGYVDSTAEEAK